MRFAASLFRFRKFLRVHRTDPNVAEANPGGVVSLNSDKDFGRVFPIVIPNRFPSHATDAVGAAGQFVVILNDDAVLNDGDDGLLDQFALFIPARDSNVMS